MSDPVFLATAIEIVTRAGTIQLDRRESGFSVSKKGEIDLVTEVDLECERMCRAVIAERFPHHDVLAEEFGAGQASGRASRWRWVFDPLDGTTNYAHGLPIFCASLGLEIDGRTEVGAVYDPTRRELFTAERGGGAHLNGRTLAVSETPRLIDSLIVTGFPYDVHLKPWDVSAGALIVEEAGGRVTGMDGSPFDAAAAHLVASNGPLHDEMLTVIREFRIARAPKRTGA